MYYHLLNKPSPSLSYQTRPPAAVVLQSLDVVLLMTVCPVRMDYCHLQAAFHMRLANTQTTTHTFTIEHFLNVNNAIKLTKSDRLTKIISPQDELLQHKR